MDIDALEQLVGQFDIIPLDVLNSGWITPLPTQLPIYKLIIIDAHAHQRIKLTLLQYYRTISVAFTVPTILYRMRISYLV